MAEPKLTLKQEAFAKEVVINGGDKVAAYSKAGYSMKGNSNTVSKTADELFNNPNVSPRIEQLQKVADKIAKESFTITVKQRLEWLKEIAEAGLGTFTYAQETKRRESLTAARSAIETMNTMLGVSDDESVNAEPLTISFQVSAPVKEIKVTNANT